MIEKGTKFKISPNTKGYYNSSEVLTVIRQSGNTIQFTLGEGKGHGSMPLEHLQYLLKRNELTEILNKRLIVEENSEEEQIS